MSMMTGMMLVGLTILALGSSGFMPLRTGGMQFTSSGAAVPPSELRRNCATARIPVAKTYTLYDLATRTAIVMWRDEQARRDVELRLPYEPETGFKDCSPSVQAHLRHVHLHFERIDREREFKIQLARDRNIDLAEMSRAQGAVLFYGSLQQNCAHYEPPPYAHVDNVGIDAERRLVFSGWWEPRLDTNVHILLPYEPETGFAGCTKAAQVLLSVFLK